jgi:hypothetical protein
VPHNGKTSLEKAAERGEVFVMESRPPLGTNTMVPKSLEGPTRRRTVTKKKKNSNKKRKKMVSGFADDPRIEFAMLCGIVLASFVLLHQFFH